MAGVARSDQKSNQLYKDQLLPLLRTYCFDCHSQDDEITLTGDDSAEKIKKNRKLWIRALTQVQIGTMPPEDGDALDDATRKKIVALMDRLANAVDCVQNPNAGKVALRRLNRNEYRNTIRDLTGVDYRPASNFPGDDVGYGFDNVGDVMSMPPILLEKYLDAAEHITGKAIYTPPPPEIFEIEPAIYKLKGADRFGNGGGQLVMHINGTVALETNLPFGGEFTLTMRVSASQIGDEPAKMTIQTDRFKKTVDVPNTNPEEKKFKIRLGKGKRKIEFSFINDFYVPKKGDRNLNIHYINLSGSQRRSAIAFSDSRLPVSHKVLIFKTPSANVTPAQASAEVLGRFASRAFRRPVLNAEVAKLVRLTEQVRADGGTYEESIQVALQAILVSPHFIFRVERPRAPDSSGKMPLISDYELATRISYLLWSSMPDDELLLMAHKGELRDSRKLLEKIGRMINDSRFNRFVDNFASQWLQLRNLKTANPDERLYRGFDDQIRILMRRETLTFVANVMRKNMPVTTLLDADFTYLNEPLARFYGIAGVSGDEFRPVSLKGSNRGGLLTHASVLTVTSNPTRTSPVKRGKWILDNLLNTPPPPAPANVPELEKERLSGTLRQRMEQHRKNPACAACHKSMDPLGFALENFDAVGQWRTRDGGKDIDASGTLPDGTKFDGALQLRQLLATSRRDQFVRCLVEKMLVYAVGRGTEYYDKCAVDKIVADIRQKDFRFAYVIAGIIQSDPFQKQGFRE